MTISPRDAIIIGAAMATLTACAGAGAVLRTTPASNTTSVIAGNSRSWVLPEAKSENLLYVSNAGDVYIYSFPASKLVGTLTGFQEVGGVCSDAAGNVWVANSAGFDVIEYAHGGSSPIAKLSDPQEYAYSCSVDSRTGDLAVSNIFALEPSQPGGIAIYRRARGRPHAYSDASFLEYNFIGYGPKGKIYFDGNGSKDPFQLARLYRGSFTPIAISGATIPTPGGVQYAEGSLTIAGADQSGNAIVYRITTAGTVTGSTELAGAYSCISYEIWKAWIICVTGNENVAAYRYPDGGNAIVTIDQPAFQAVISERPSR